MFESVVVGVKDLEAARGALLRPAQALTSANHHLTLAQVQVAAPPAPDSGAAESAARRWYALERLAALRDESQLDPDAAPAEAQALRLQNVAPMTVKSDLTNSSVMM